MPERDTLEVFTPEEFHEKYNVDVRVRHRVLGLNPQARTLRYAALDFGSEHEEKFDRFIVATGAAPRQLNIPGEDAPNVFTLRDFVDAQTVKGYLDSERVRHVVLVGGGYVNTELAETLRSRGIRVTILEQLGRLLATSAAPSIGRHMDDAARRRGVIVRKERPAEFRHDAGGRVNVVITDRGEHIGCQAVIIAVGLHVRTGLLEDAGLAFMKNGEGLDVGDDMKTNRPNVWACGDAVAVRRVVDGARIQWPISPIARRTARVAARNAVRRAGQTDRFQGFVGSVAVRAFGVEVARIGIDLAEAERAGIDAVAVDIQHWSRVKIYPGSKPLYVRLVAERGTGRLLGGQLAGEEGAALRANVLVPLIRHGATADELAEDIDLVYNPPIAPAMDPLRIAAAQVAKEAGSARWRG